MTLCLIYLLIYIFCECVLVFCVHLCLCLITYTQYLNVKYSSDIESNSTYKRIAFSRLFQFHLTYENFFISFFFFKKIYIKNYIYFKMRQTKRNEMKTTTITTATAKATKLINKNLYRREWNTYYAFSKTSGAVNL